MKNHIFLYIFIELINLSFNIIPLWNLKESSIDLLLKSDSNTFKIYENIQNNNLHALLIKNINKNDKGFESQNNISMIDSENASQQILWEDIYYSSFINGIGHFICPKGNDFLNQYDKKAFYPKIPSDFKEDGDKDWDLICYHQPISNYIFQGFLNRKTKTPFYGIKYDLINNNKYKWLSQDVKDGFLDFIWTKEKKMINLICLLFFWIIIEFIYRKY